MRLEELRARHDRGQLPTAELEALTDDEVRVLALDEALYGRGVVAGVAAAVDEQVRRLRAAGRRRA